MLEKVLEVLSDVPDGLYVDATLGGGGHAEALLEANPGLRLLGIDRDDRATGAASRRLDRFGDRVEIVRSPFSAIDELVLERTGEGASAVLFDLGVSSPQLDEPDRGFSYRAAAPLDMRMDRREPLSAEGVVNDYSFAQLRRLISRYGEERFADRIARAIVDARPVADTEQLAEIVANSIPAAARRKGGHPAKRTFQAIRIEVNSELAELETALDAALSSLTLHGRIAVLSYHSLEDRMVKGALREAETGGCTCPPGLECVCGAIPTVKLLRRGAWKPDDAEVEANPRSRSVRMRAAEELVGVGAGDGDDGGVGWAS
ncbi:MAG: 16S rRNA (cytosine(1402)-N(4))-methyltransferase RsmH [Actinomycetia bacterium]|nr:16S rRNA (cytosine(1402)-N(4))-methyltransferase RsmH [Actinomycetes bacterium]